METTYDRIERLLRRNRMIGKKMSVTAMCRSAGVAQGSISDLKSGRTQNLSAENALKLSRYFGVTADYLLYGDGESEESGLYERIKTLCDERGINITEMCQRSGASRASLTDLKVGRKNNLSAETLVKIADYFGVTVDHLLGREPQFSYERFDSLRASKGITKRHIAEKLNRNQQIFQDWKNGKSKPNAAQLEVVAETLWTTVGYLLGLGTPTDPEKPQKLQPDACEKLGAVSEELKYMAASIFAIKYEAERMGETLQKIQELIDATP